MSTFASSVINKSGKKFAPKASVRRGAATSQPPSSSRVSVERQASAPALPRPNIRTDPNIPLQPQATSLHPITSTSTHRDNGPDTSKKPREGSTPIPAPIRRRAISPSSKSTLIPTPARRRAISPPISRPVSVVRGDQAHAHVTSQPNLANGKDTGARGSQDASQLRGLVPGGQEATREPARKRRKIGASNTRESQALETIHPTIEATSDAEETSFEQAVTSKKSRTKPKMKTKESAEALAEDTNARVVITTRAKRRRPSKRLRTPENAEEVEITTTVVKMADLCKDLHTGKKSQREEALRLEMAKKKQEATAHVEATDSNLQPAGDAPQESTELRTGQSGAANPQMRLVNNEIVLDSSSLQVDRHAEHTAVVEAGKLIEENPLTHKVNSASYLKKSAAVSWDEDNTALFYRGLRMFGTDFQMISRMFPGMPRRAIKLKFSNEERKDAQRIKETLLGPKEEVDLAQFSLMTNTVYEDPSTFARDVKDDEMMIEEQHAKDKEAHEEMIREAARQAERLAMEETAGAAESSAKENDVEDNPDAENVTSLKTKSRRSGTRTKPGEIRTKNGGGISEVFRPVETPLEAEADDIVADAVRPPKRTRKPAPVKGDGVPQDAQSKASRRKTSRNPKSTPGTKGGVLRKSVSAI